MNELPDIARLAAVVQAMIDEFGDRAIAVAESQLALADSTMEESWSSIVDALRSRLR